MIMFCIVLCLVAILAILKLTEKFTQDVQDAWTNGYMTAVDEQVSRTIKFMEDTVEVIRQG